jgi:tRNA pseudouridine55 synthase
MDGVLIIDKPAGMTSHDVVQRVRRAAGTSRVGHAGTLDPMATGVLVVMIGEATKLGPYLTAEDKRYEARIALGAATDTLDADGAVVARAPLPEWWGSPAAAGRIEQALGAERARREQIPPAFSALKIDGVSAHARARRGENLELAARPVVVHTLELVELSADGFVDLTMRVGKGYYVRSLARDLGHALGCPAHLARLRRTASGAFGIVSARRLEQLSDRQVLSEALISVAAAASTALPTAVLSPVGAARARQGKPLADEDFDQMPAAEAVAFCHTAWLDQAGALVGVGRRERDKHRILRGFR